ncbi:hypothetical protein MF271_22225 (plasmid) [Deinococcus sp. KNUC1210]|uniref:hypothetical protein n=1 Tax=Deinococcus sp. KNUC1210 TaxID=2917691 RepID=UPI001EF12C67|nr:hypothetical protein [Deinococcus sp. KNUC1210]ULH18190.1 hypothetical protein MF271_22225 [Deinococcus sp. KNUC1210]
MTFHHVIGLASGPVAVGVVENHWVYKDVTGVLCPLEESAPQCLVTILEWGDALVPALRKGLVACGLDASLAATFPCDRGVRMGLTWPSEHWQALALQWVEREATAGHFLPELQTLTTEGRTQRIRHLARRLARTALRTNHPVL